MEILEPPELPSIFWGGMSDFENFQIWRILLISSDRPETIIEHMVVEVTWYRFKSTQIHCYWFGKTSESKFSTGWNFWIFRIVQYLTFWGEHQPESKEYGIYFQNSFAHLFLVCETYMHLDHSTLSFCGKTQSLPSIPILTLV